MNYRELQKALRPYREKGLTDFMLNLPKPTLEAELLRLESAPVAGEASPDEVVKISQLEDEQVAKTEPETPQSTDAKEIDTVAKILPLAIEGRWFDMIASGEKKEEYRAIKPYYESRFNKPLTHIKFTNGYGDDRPSFTIELLGIEKGIPKPEWSEGTIEQGTEVYVLKLGKIIDANFELPVASETECPKCNGAGTVVAFDWSDMSYPDVKCEECDGSGYVDGGNTSEPIAWIDGEAVYPSTNKNSSEAIEVCNFCRGTGVYGGSPCFHCGASGFDEEDSESDYLASNLTGNYRMDADEKEDEGWWLEELDDAGLPKEDYIAVDDTELARLKANGQIWEYSSKVERWVPPNNDNESVLGAMPTGGGYAIASIAAKVMPGAVVKPWTSPGKEESYRCADDVAIAVDDVDAEIEVFLNAVSQKELSDEQLGAIALALVVANDRSITASEALAQAGQFRLFTPKQLLAWGFDHIIPRSGMLARFRDAITKSKRRAIVCIKFSPDPENAALLTAWAASYKGIIYCRTSKDGYQHEEWGFPSLEYAEQFCEYCAKLNFVQSATIETNALSVETPEKNLAEVA